MTQIARRLWILLLLALTACHTADHPRIPVTTFTANALSIDYRISIGQPLDAEQCRRITQIIRTTFDQVDQIFNKWNPDSEISRLNRLKAKTEVSISEELAAFLVFIDQIVALTEARFDPTVEPLQQLWKQKLKVGQTPNNQEIAEIMPATGWDKVHFKNHTFYKDHDLVALDLGGIAKGYCVDLLVERLNAAGFLNVFVEWGGEIRVSGQHPDKRPWRIFISRFGDPNPENGIALLNLVDEAIATSGDYLQNWTVSGITYYHIFDAKTYRPLVATDTSIASASVVAPTCALADGLATAAMMFPSIEEAQRWADQIRKQLPEVQFYLEARKSRVVLNAK